MHRPFRFIHSSDFHLERPPHGLSEVPDHLREAFSDAPYRAAARVFDAAVKERVDFVALAGDLVDPVAAGPRGMIFLNEQFRRLADHKIEVYWAGGRADNFDRFLSAWSLPDNVRRFPVERIERMTHHRDGLPLAQLMGASSQQRKKIRAAEFGRDASELFSVAIAYGSIDAETLARSGIHYWALGGEHSRRTPCTGPAVAHYPGTPQGRRPQESSSRGCTLVEVDQQMQVRTSFIPTDAVRYLQEQVMVTPATAPEQLQQILDERMEELLGDPFGPELLVHWTISGSAALANELRRGRLAADLTTRLQATHAHKRPGAWTVSIEATDGPLEEALYGEDTLLGEFLRTVRHYVEHPDDELSLEPYLSERHLAGSIGSAVALQEPLVRNRVLAEVARLGVDLLSPEETQP